VAVTTTMTVADDDGGRLRKRKGEGRGSGANMAAFYIINERASHNNITVSRARTDVITIFRRMAKQKSVLRQNTFKTLLKSVCQNRKCFEKTKNRKCFQSVGAIC